MSIVSCGMRGVEQDSPEQRGELDFQRYRSAIVQSDLRLAEKCMIEYLLKHLKTELMKSYSARLRSGGMYSYDDLEQDVCDRLISAHRRGVVFSNVFHISSYSRRIMINLINDVLRRSKRAPLDGDEMELEAVPDQQLSDSDLIDKIDLEALRNKLEPQQQRLFDLVLQDTSSSEARERLGIGVGAYRSRLFRLRGTLRSFRD